MGTRVRLLPKVTGLDTVIIGGPHPPFPHPPEPERLQHNSHISHIGINVRCDGALYSSPWAVRVQRMRRRFLQTLSVAAALLVVIPALAGAAATPATQSATADFTDPRGDIRHGADLVHVRVHNGATLQVTLRFRDIRRAAFSDFFKVFVDTRLSHPGPDYAIAGGLSEGTDWATQRATRNWNLSGDPLDKIGTCASSVKINWATNIVRISLGRDCLGRHQGRVRLSVQSGDQSHNDYAPAKKTFYRWIPRG